MLLNASFEVTAGDDVFIVVESGVELLLSMSLSIYFDRGGVCSSPNASSTSLSPSPLSSRYFDCGGVRSLPNASSSSSLSSLYPLISISSSESSSSPVLFSSFSSSPSSSKFVTDLERFDSRYVAEDLKSVKGRGDKAEPGI